MTGTALWPSTTSSGCAARSGLTSTIDIYELAAVSFTSADEQRLVQTRSGRHGDPGGPGRDHRATQGVPVASQDPCHTGQATTPRYDPTLRPHIPTRPAGRTSPVPPTPPGPGSSPFNGCRDVDTTDDPRPVRHGTSTARCHVADSERRHVGQAHKHPAHATGVTFQQGLSGIAGPRHPIRQLPAPRLTDTTQHELTIRLFAKRSGHSPAEVLYCETSARRLQCVTSPVQFGPADPHPGAPGLASNRTPVGRRDSTATSLR